MSDGWISNATELSKATCSLSTSSFTPLLVSQPTSAASFNLPGVGVSRDSTQLSLGFDLDLKIENQLVQTVRTFSLESNTTGKKVQRQKNLLDDETPGSFFVEGVLLVLFFIDLLKFNE